MAQEHLLPASFIDDHVQDLVLKSQEAQEMLDKVAEFCALALTDPAGVFCSITLIQGSKPVTMASSEERALRLDATQYSAGVGPCLSAIRRQLIVHVPDLASDGRWAAYTLAGLEEGVGSSLSVPLALEGEAAAGINLYSTRSYGFTDEDVDSVQACAGHASKALRLAVRISQLVETKTRLLASLESRTAIDMATGALMAQNRCSLERAIEILKIASDTRNVELEDVAASVVASLSHDAEAGAHSDA